MKSCAHSLCRPLTDLVNLSLKEGIFPDLLKFTIVKPLKKNPQKSCIDNLRPVALLTSLSKVFEKVVYNRLYSYFKNSELFTSCQFGFQKGKSTSDAIFEFLNAVSSAVDGSQYTVGAFCDLSKAFDCVDHEILIGKLWCYGVRGLALDWIASYLYNRHQKVVISQGAESGFLPVSSGVPQGSILGPLLFLVYINDLPMALPNDSVFLYADDTSFVLSHKNKSTLSSSLTTALQNLSSWFNANNFLLNSAKSQFINFFVNNRSSVHSDSAYLSSDINVVPSAKFLGVVLDSCLTWRQHISQLLPKLGNAFFALLTLSHSVDERILKQVYFAYAHSQLSYGVIFWGNSPDSGKIFLMQKRIVRIVARAGFRDPCKPIFQRLQILPLPSIYIFQCILYVRLNWNKFIQNNHTHSYLTRNANILQYPLHKTSFFEKAPFYSAIKLFNHLPVSIKCEVSDKVFRKKLFSFLLANCFYSTSEFYTCRSGS